MSVTVRLFAIALLLPTSMAAAQTPRIVVSPTSLTFTRVTGSGKSPAQSVAITNGGGGTLDKLTRSITYTSPHVGTDGLDVNWLQIAFANKSTTAPTALDVTAHATGTLPSGTYTATIAIKDKDAVNSPQTVLVVLRVGNTPAVLGITPATLDFGSVGVGVTSPAQRLIVTNSGFGTSGPISPIPFASSLVGGANAGDFLVLGTTCPLAGIPAGVTCTFDVAFRPQGTGARLAGFAFQASPGGTVNATLTGTATPTFTVTPSTHDFGAVGVGGASAAQAFTIRNDADLPTGPLTIPGGALGTPGAFLGGANPGDFRPDPTSSCIAAAAGGLAPHTSCDIVLWFTPTETGPRSAGFSLTASPGGTVVAALSGTGTTAQVIVVTPPSHDFGTFGGGLPSVTQRFVLTNPLPWPTGPLQPYQTPGAPPSPLIGGPNPGDFYVDPNSSCAQVLATGLPVGGSCYFDVTFLPTGLGARSATLVFQMAPGGVVQIPFSGNSLATGFLTITPLTKDFGSVGIGGASAAQTFTITNHGFVQSGPFTVVSGGLAAAGAALTGANPGDFRPDPNSSCATALGGLAPRTSCDIVLWFSPTAVGPRSAALALAASPGGTVIAGLSGTGTTAQVIVVTPSAHDYGDVGFGFSSPTQRFVLTNPLPWPTGPMQAVSGGLGGIGGGVVGANPGDFYFDPNSSCAQVLSVGLAAGASCYFDVTFIPQGLGPRSADLVFSMTPGGVVQIPFSGNGVAAQALTFSPASHDFGILDVGTTSPPQRFTLTNTGAIATGQLVPQGPGGTNPTDFNFTLVACAATSGGSLPPGGTCVFDVTFTPTDAGTRTASIGFAASPGGSVTLQLTGEGQFRIATVLVGTVRDLDGHPVAGVTVAFAEPGSPVATTAADGGYMLTGITAGQHQVVATKPGACVDHDAGTVAIGDGDIAILSFTMNCPPYAVGTVSITGPPPTVPLAVTLTPVRGGQSLTGPVAADGHYVVEMGEDEYGIVVSGLPLRCRAFGEVIGATQQQEIVTTDFAVTCTDERFRATPAAYDFGTVRWGDAQTVVVTITNVSESPAFLLPLGLNSPAVCGGSGLSCPYLLYDYGMVGNDCPVGIPVDPGAHCTAVVQFSPQGGGVRAGQLVQRAYPSDPGTVLAQFTGMGASIAGPPTLTLAPAAADFGTWTIGQTSSTATFTVTNVGATPAGPLAPITLGGLHPSSFVLDASACAGVALGSGASCTVTVSFRPDTAGARQSDFQLAASPGGSFVVPLTGTAVPATGTLVLSTTSAAVTFVDAGGLVHAPPITITSTGTISGLGIGQPMEGTTPVNWVYRALYLGVPDTLLDLYVWDFPPNSVPYGVHVVTVPVTALGATNSPQYVTLTVSAGTPTQTTLTASVNPVATGVVVRYTAHVAHLDGTPVVPSGGPVFVQFNLSGQAFNVVYAQLDANGNASVDASFTAAGSYPISVSFAGAAPSLPSSAQLTQVVTALPALVLTPASFDFGNRQVAFTAGGVFFFTVTNGGSAATAALDQFSFTGAAAADFSISDQQCLGVSLAPGVSCTLSVQFIPQAAGPRSATLTVGSSADGSTGSALVSGTGVAPAVLVVTPSPKDFGPVVVGQTGSVVTFTLTNTGPSDAGLYLTDSLLGVGRADYIFEPFGCGSVSLNAGTNCTFRVSFKPTVAGPRPATLVITFFGGTASVNLTGTGTNSQFSIVPDSFRFGAFPIGQSSAPASFTIINAAVFPTGTINSFTLTGVGAASYSVAQGTCAGADLNPGASCTFSVTFTSQIPGGQPATLTVTTSIGFSGSTELRGFGLAPAVLTATPASHDFGWAYPGQGSAPVMLTVTNTGAGLSGVININSLAFSGPNAAEFAYLDTSTCLGPIQLEPGASCTVDVIFFPQALGPRAATVTVTALGAGGGSVTITLTGGVTPAGVLTIAPTSANFGTVPIGMFTLPTTFTVTNVGTTPAILSAPEIQDPLGTNYLFELGSLCGSVLDPGVSCQLVVHFEPQNIGPIPAALVVHYDNGTASASLTGVGSVATASAQVAVGPFTPKDAARDLLGVPALTDMQRRYLDMLGNRDGVYDLGDFLAFLDRNHLKVSPALLRGLARRTEGVQ